MRGKGRQGRVQCLGPELLAGWSGHGQSSENHETGWLAGGGDGGEWEVQGSGLGRVTLETVFVHPGGELDSPTQGLPSGLLFQ